MAAEQPVSVFVSYAQQDAAHMAQVAEFCAFLRDQGIDVAFDMHAADRPRDWAIWMQRQVEERDFVLVVASPAYRRRAEEREQPGTGRGVRWEARLIREYVYAAQDAGLARVLSVVLPGGSAADIPLWLQPYTRTHYAVHGFTAQGVAPLLDYLLGRRGAPESANPPATPAAQSQRAQSQRPQRPPAAWPASVGGDFVAGDKYGDTIVSGGKHIHHFPHRD